MFLKKTYAVLGTGLMWSAFMLASTSQAQTVGEQRDSSPNVLALCNCNTPESCKALLGQQNNESKQAPQQGQHAGVSSAIRSMTTETR